jgi:hypothetical protein
MLAFLYGFLGALAALALLAAIRRRQWRGMAGGGQRRGFLLRGLFRRLGTRPDQESVLAGEADALAAELRALREEGRALREEVAAMLDAPAIDRAAVEEALERRLARLTALRARAAEALRRVHGTLDERQRRALAALVRSGGRRHAHACR